MRLLISLIVCLSIIHPAHSVSYRITYSPGQKDKVRAARGSGSSSLRLWRIACPIDRCPRAMKDRSQRVSRRTATHACPPAPTQVLAALPARGFYLLAEYEEFNFVTAMPYAAVSLAAASSKKTPPPAKQHSAASAGYSASGARSAMSDASSSAAASVARAAAADATAAQVKAHVLTLSSIKGVASVRKEYYFKLLAAGSNSSSNAAKAKQGVCDTGGRLPRGCVGWPDVVGRRAHMHAVHVPAMQGRRRSTRAAA